MVSKIRRLDSDKTEKKWFKCPVRVYYALSVSSAYCQLNFRFVLILGMGVVRGRGMQNIGGHVTVVRRSGL